MSKNQIVCIHVSLLLSLLSFGAETARAQATASAESPATPAATTTQTTTVTLPPVGFAGDFRYRHEWLGNHDATIHSTHQHRIRARLGAKASLPSNTQIEVRLATSTGRTSTNQTLGGSGSAFSNYTVTLDRANFRWNPLENAYLQGGRFGTTFFAPGESDLIWDADLNFDGLALGGSLPVGNLSLFLNGGHFWIDKSTTFGRKDVSLDSLQLGARHKISDSFHWAAGGALHYYNGILRHPGLVSTVDMSMNSSAGLAGTAIYIKDYNLVNAGFELGVKIGAIPVLFLGDWVKNLATNEYDSGWLAGVKIGKLKDGGDWSLAYDYRRLEKDAVIGAFAEADVFGGGTDGRAHRYNASYQVAKHWTVGATYYNGVAGMSREISVERDRFQADLLFKF